MVSSMDDTHVYHMKIIYVLYKALRIGGMFIATIETLRLNNPICEGFFFSSFFFFFFSLLGRKMER
jgi:hypothetical protein